MSMLQPFITGIASLLPKFACRAFWLVSEQTGMSGGAGAPLPRATHQQDALVRRGG